MKKFKKLAVLLVAFALTAACCPVQAAGSSSITEDFEYETADEVTQSPILYGFTNPPIIETAALPGGGRYVNLSCPEDSDTIMITKEGLLSYDVTAVDVWLKSSDASWNPAKWGKVILDSKNTTQYLMDFTYNCVRDVLSTSGGTKALEFVRDQWYLCRFRFDRPNKQITMSFPGYGYSVTKTMEEDWGADAHLNFQTVQGNVLGIDGLSIRNAEEVTNDTIIEDFEHAALGSPLQNGILEYLNPESVSVQTEAAESNQDDKNCFLSLDASVKAPTICTKEKANPKLGTPVVIDFKLRATPESSIEFVYQYNTSAGAIKPMKITDGTLFNASNQPCSLVINDNKFHSYRIILTKQETGTSIILFVDGKWVSTNVTAVEAVSERLFGFVRSGGVDLDDLHIYDALPAKLLCKIQNGETDVGIHTPLTFESNNPINFSTVKPENFTLLADGDAVPITLNRDDEKNAFVVVPDGGLQPGTVYTFATVENKVKDNFDQYYNCQLTFTTEQLDAVEAQISYTVNGQPAPDGQFTTGTLEFQLDVTANTSAGAEIFAAAAHFDKNNTLISVKTLSSAIDGQGTDTQAGTLTIERAEGTTVKLFLWDGNQRPMGSSPVVLTPQQ